jgi:UDP-N-acetylglucosamine 3-dehydrogenase
MKEIHLAVIGAGLIGSLYSRIITQTRGVKLLAVCDVVEERAETLATELHTNAYGGNRCQNIFRDFPELDGVLVCTSEAFHLDPALASLEYGKHLFVEKPLASDGESARRLVAAAQGIPVVTMVGYSLRFDPRYYLMKQAVSKSEIGEIIQIYARRTPSVAALERIQARVELPFWVGVHDLDMMRWITGSEFCLVYAQGTSIDFHGRCIQAAIHSNLKFKNGVIAVLENSWRMASVSAQQQSTAHFKVQGTKGEIEVKSHEQGVTIMRNGEMYNPDTVYMPELYGTIIGVYRNQIEHFVTCIRENRSSGIPFEDGLAGVLAAEAILRSVELGKEISIS